MPRSILTLLNFNKTYHTVWREKLLLNMLDAGIQCTFTEHMSNPLMSSAPVGISPKVYLQDSILAPVLFLFLHQQSSLLIYRWCCYSTICRYVSILTTARKREDAEAAAQSIINSVFDWIQQWKLSLNVDKSDACPFSSWSNDST